MSPTLKKWLKWIGIALLIYIIYRVISNRLEAPKPAAPVITPGGTINVPAAFIYNPAAVNRTRAFGIGTNNSNEVAYLQTWLNAYYNSGLIVDGDFGAKTLTALLLVKPTANQASTTLDALGI